MAARRTISAPIPVSALVKKLRKDSRYLKLKDTFDTHRDFRIPLNDLLDEIKSGHKIRLVRRLNATDPKFVDEVMKAILDDQSKRSRATEIIVQCVHVSKLLTTSLEALHFHLLQKHSDDLRVFGTKDERKQVVTMALKPFNSYLDDVSVLRESAQLFVADIDKAAWSLKSMIDCMSLHHAPERRV